MTFGSFTLPHVLDIQTTKARLTTERDIPHASVAYRTDDRDLGQSITLSGEIRENDIDAVCTMIEGIRGLNDGVTRTLDLEDGETPVMNAKLVNPQYRFAVGQWFNTGRCYIPYAVTFYETS